MTDPKKKEIYDRYGEEGLKNGMGGGSGFSFEGGFDPFDIFSQFFGGGSGFSGASFGGNSRRGGMGGFPGGFSFNMGGGPGASFSFGDDDYGYSHRPKRPVKADDINVDLNLTLEELYTGCQKTRKITKTIVDARGQRTQQVNTVDLNIMAGWKDGTKLRFPELGNEEPGIIPADVVFVVKTKLHNRFKRENDDLHLTIRVTLLQALTGGDIWIDHLDGTKIKHSLTRIITSETVDKIKGKGMPIRKFPGQFGDMYVHYKIKNPTYLTEQQKFDLRKLLSQVESWE